MWAPLSCSLNVAIVRNHLPDLLIRENKSVTRVEIHVNLLTISKLENTDTDHFHNDQHNLPRAAQISFTNQQSR